MIKLILCFTFLISTSIAQADVITEYFTYKTNSVDQTICKMEGTLLVRGVLYVWSGGRCRRAERQCQYGMGNRNNCLTPCKSIAADKRYWSSGDRVYISQLDGRRCPFTGEIMDGNFVVADVGAWIKGNRRFDIFMGVCVRQSGGVCRQYDRSLRYDFQRSLVRSLGKRREQ